MTRYDAVNFIAHGVAKDPAFGERRPVKGADAAPRRRRHRSPSGPRKPRRRALPKYCVDLNEKARQGRRRSPDRPRGGGRALHPGPLPPAQEQPAPRRRPRRRQDRHRRGAGPEDRPRRDARRAGRRHHLLARHGRAAGRHPLPRRLRGAAEGRRQRARGAPDAVLFIDEIHTVIGAGATSRRRDGRLEPAQARAAGRQAALHGLDHLQGVPPALREGPRAVAAVPEDRRQRALGRGHGQDPQGPEALLRGRTTTSATPPTRSAPRWSCRRATSTTASCPTRRST